jgi:molecular chaperone Hsp33
MAEPRPSDVALRAVTNDGAFRVITVRATDTVRRLIAAQSLWGSEAVQLADVVTSAILLRETMAPQFRLQALLRSGDGSTWLGESHPDGGGRGLLGRKDKGAPATIQGGMLEVSRTLQSGEVHRGVVQFPVGAGVSQAFMIYLQESEQVVSMTAVACVLGEDHVVAAGGYLVQLLPDVGQGPLAIMTERLRDFEDIGPLLAKTDAEPSLLMDELLYGMPFTRLEASALTWKCRCSAERVVASIATLPRADIESLAADDKPLELTCDFCQTAYVLTVDQLKTLLADVPAGSPPRPNV